VTVSRDVLIILLVLGLLANVALIGSVAWIRHRAAGQPPTTRDADPGAPVAADDTDPARLTATSSDSSEPDWVPAASAEPAEPIPAPEPVRPAARRPAARQRPRTRTERGAAPAPRSATAEPGGRRSRRFVMPDDDGSHARTDRAIAAFLGEPVAPDPETRAHRRRHRARRPAGAPVPKTDLVVSLAGSDPDPRIVHALSAALRGAVRTSDQVVELPRGRLRITLEADAGGGDAFVRRAHGVVKPWLTALDPALELRVERPRASRSTAAST
jgi:hypothetical protein